MAILTTAKNQDIELLRTFAKGNDFEAFAAIVNRHAGMVFETGKRLTGNEQEAEEAAKVCFRELSKIAASIEVPPVVWLHGMATSEAKRIVALRKKSGKTELEAKADLADTKHPSAGEQEAWQQLLGMMDESIDELTENSREVVLLHYLEGRSAEQIAGEAGIDLAVVKQRLWGALNDLWPVMVRRGFGGTIQTMQGMLAAQRAGNAPPELLVTLGNLAVSDAFWSQFIDWAQHSLMAKVVGALLVGLFVGGPWYLLSKHRPSASGAQIVNRLEEKNLQRAATASAASAAASKVVLAERAAVEGVAALGWGKSGQTTFCGALAAALAPSKAPVDYQTLMGVSALAFRTRWYHGDTSRYFAGSCAIGEQAEERELVGKAIGKKLDVVWLFGANNPKRPGLIADIAASIDAGRPVLTYVAPHLDMAVVFGYEDHGRMLRVRDYYEETPEEVPSTRVGGFFIFIKDGKPGLEAKEALKAGLAAAVRNYSRTDHPSFDEGNPSVFFYGKEAYEQWMADIEKAETFSPADRKWLFDASNWNFSCLNDARHAAAGYLKASAGRADLAPARQALLNAAGVYDQLAAVTARSQGARDSFLGPWSGKTIDNWTTDVRGREIAVLKEAQKLDKQAMGELKNAHSALSATK